MSAYNNLLRAEMEVNPRLKNEIAVHHIIQVISPVIIIICKTASTSFSWPLLMLISAIVPTGLFIIFWIASKCSYQDLRLILVHFNTFLSTLWFLVHFPFCVICLICIDGILSIVIIIITAFLSLSSAMFATYGIWKSARNVVLSERLVNREHYDVLVSNPPTVHPPDMYSEINVQRRSQANYIYEVLSK
ncbi:hypothetical protein ACJMK2_029637 [Sinanodonta woodiana]|uniref:Uncharacterized protein n=1 Tax=Sinanodonta woodiana TaxID=1069815 RepID=A0ABD3XET4_SINWO